MAKAKQVIVKETIQELKQFLKKQPNHLRDRVRMLIEIKKTDSDLSKTQLATILSVNHNSVQAWRTKYLRGGIEELLSHKKTGYKPSVFSEEQKNQIKEKLEDPLNGLTGYKELQQWVNENIVENAKYVTVNSYVKRNFGAKLKVARKSHINKDAEAGETFKKTSVKKSKK